MIRFLRVPQLPEGSVCELAIGGEYLRRLREPLEGRGIRCIALPPNPALDPRIASHADLSLLHLGGECFAGAEELDYETDFPIISKVPTYIHDCALNVCIAGEYVIACPEYAHVLPKDKTLIAVRQRYTRCSVCIVDEHSIITADPGIARACSGKLDVLCITPGFIELPGFDYGFIGGASFKPSRNEIAFTGTLDEHPDKERIEAFLKERGVCPVYLTEDKCFDCGSAVLLREKIEKLLP